VESAAITLAPPTRTGYAFGGWHDNAEFSGSAVTGITTGSTGNKTFHAKWTAISYTVAYDKNADDATGTTTASAHTYDMAQALSANGFARTGYAFGGWSAQADGNGTSYDDGQSVGNLTATQGATVTLYAKWTLIAYSITYNLNGGTTGANPANYTVASSAIALNPATRAGYNFGGWHSDAGYTTAASGIPAGSTGDKTFHAKWTAITYTVAYDKNADDATGATTASAHTYDMAQALSSNGFARTGYAFGGWSAQADGNGTSYSDGQSVSNLTATQGATVTLYAKWNPGASLQITLQPGPGDPPLSNASVFVDEEARFSVEGNYASWTWRWNGEIISGADTSGYILTANSKSAGIHELAVSVVTTDTGETLSARCRVTIKEK
jgi:uncharacterized repeat protein (TIGR02543 family)